MAFQIPSLADLSSRIRAAFRSEIPGADAEIWPNNLYVVAKVVAGSVYEAFLRLDWLYRQIYASTATGEHLDRHAYEVGLARKPAAYGSGLITVTGNIGEIIPIGRRFVRSDGRAYITTEARIIPDGGSVTVAVRAVDAGTIQNTAGSTTLLREGSYPELTSDATISSSGIRGGANAESDDDLRARILYRRRNPPMGGSLSDYRIWAESVIGVRKAFVAAFDGGGMVAVYPIADGYGAQAIPSDDIVDAVAEAIEVYRPVTASVVVTAPTTQLIHVVVDGLEPASNAVKEEIKRELLDMFREKGGVALPGSTLTFPISWISAAIDAAAGEVRHTLVAPAADVPLTAGKLPILGSLTFT